MAIYHLSCKPISRSAGHSVAAALAYQSGEELAEMDGKKQNYSSKEGVEQTGVFGCQLNLQEFADAVELSEKRKNSTLGRSFILALPEEVGKTERWAMVEEFAKHLHKTHGVAVAAALHQPDKGGDQRNHHAHVLISDRRVGEDGRSFGEKARELTAAKTSKESLKNLRARWAEVVNDGLEAAGSEARVSHESLKAQGINRVPQEHLGREATEMVRKGYEIEKHRRNTLKSLVAAQRTRAEEAVNGRGSEVPKRRVELSIERPERTARELVIGAAKRARWVRAKAKQSERELRYSPRAERGGHRRLSLSDHLGRGLEDRWRLAATRLAKWRQVGRRSIERAGSRLQLERLFGRGKRSPSKVQLEASRRASRDLARKRSRARRIETKRGIEQSRSSDRGPSLER